MDKLTGQQVTEAINELPDWRLDEKTISRRYRFKTFVDAIRFVNLIADEAERRNHHPFIAIDYKFVTLRLTSWHAGGLTKVDFEEAKSFDNHFNQFS